MTMRDAANDVEEVLKAISNPVRRQILSQMKDPAKNFPGQDHHYDLGVCAGKIDDACGLSQSTVSAHLAILQHARLITARRVGQYVFYKRNEKAIAAFSRTSGAIVVKSLPAPLIALALSAFAIGTTEFVIMGLLPQVAQNLAISLPKAGWLISGYALGVFIGAPIMAVATQKLPPRHALLALMGVFILGNALCALAPGYGFLMVARIVTALCHGAFFGIGAVEAAALVAPNKRAQAVALMFTGLTLANVLGVPLGTALGQAAGWRMTFWAVAVIGVTAFAGLYLLLPRDKQGTPAPAMLREFIALKPAVWLTLLITVISSASMFALFTYIAPILNDITHVSPRGVTYTLFLVGIGMTIGNTIGGRLSDWRLNTTLIGVFIASAITLGVFVLIAGDMILTEAALFLWAAIVFAGCSALQMRAVTIGRAAPNLISTLNIGAFNAGNALGAWAGGEVIARGFGLDAIPLAAAMLSIFALVLTILSLLPARQFQNA